MSRSVQPRPHGKIERTFESNSSISVGIFRPHVRTPIVCVDAFVKKPTRGWDIRDPGIPIINRGVYKRFGERQRAKDQEKETA